MSNDDSALYTGVDNSPVEDTGIFGNEAMDESTKQQIAEQEHKLKELTPQLESILEMLNAEKKTAVDFVTGLVDDASLEESKAIVEIKAAARYRRYLDELITKFTLQLNETKK